MQILPTPAWTAVLTALATSCVVEDEALLQFSIWRVRASDVAEVAVRDTMSLYSHDHVVVDRRLLLRDRDASRCSREALRVRMLDISFEEANAILDPIYSVPFRLLAERDEPCFQGSDLPSLDALGPNGVMAVSESDVPEVLRGEPLRSVGRLWNRVLDEGSDFREPVAPSIEVELPEWRWDLE